MIIFHRLHRDLRLSAHTADCPVAAAENARKESVCNSVPSGSTSYSRRNKDAITTLYLVSADVPETGRWMHSLRIRLKKSVKKSATARVLTCTCQAVLIHLLQQDFFPEQSESSLTCVFVDHGLLA